MNSTVTQFTTGTAGAALWSLAPHTPVRHAARCMLIAVATADGARVDRNFEDAEAFLIYESDGDRTCFIGRQPCPLTAAAGESARRTELLSDCDLVLCSNISDSCRRTLSELGIGCNLAYAGAMISDAVSALRRT
jgi:predicted Fe-Mo cluster-binding NifX family protein